jgi:hypothetical protein
MPEPVNEDPVDRDASIYVLKAPAGRAFCVADDLPN